jgi:hypothetical protein
MMTSRPEIWLEPLDQRRLDYLMAMGAPATAIVQAPTVMIAIGTMAADGLLEPDAEGEVWLAFAEPEDFVFWQPRHNRFATFANRAFALGEERIMNAATYTFDHALSIFADPLDWLRAGRDGIVVLPGHWPMAFDRLRDAPRIALAESLLPTYRRFMKPARIPEVFVIRQKREAVA